MLDKIKNFKWGYVILFILLAAVGICFIAFTNTLNVLAIVIGAILAAFSVIYFVLTLSDPRRGAVFAFKIVICLCALICGIVTIIAQETAINIISSLFGLFLIIDGAFKLQTSAMSRRFKLASWWIMMIPAVIIIIGGYVTICLDANGEESRRNAISYILGFTIVIDAIANFISAFYISGYEKNQRNEFRAEFEKLNTPAENAVNDSAEELVELHEEAAAAAESATEENNGSEPAAPAEVSEEQKKSKKDKKKEKAEKKAKRAKSNDSE